MGGSSTYAFVMKIVNGYGAIPPRPTTLGRQNQKQESKQFLATQ